MPDGSIKRYWLTAGSAAIIAALIGGVFVLMSGGNGDSPGPAVQKTPHTTPIGKILAPRHGTRVTRSFGIEGTLSGIPAGNHVWAAVQVGNLLFPKEPEIPARDRRFAQALVQTAGLPEGRFTLVLLLVDSKGHAEIEAWLDHGRRSGDFPGLARISGASRLDVVRDLELG